MQGANALELFRVDLAVAQHVRGSGGDRVEVEGQLVYSDGHFQAVQVTNLVLRIRCESRERISQQFKSSLAHDFTSA
jgi:hypothetical protein